MNSEGVRNGRSHFVARRVTACDFSHMPQIRLNNDAILRHASIHVKFQTFALKIMYVD